MAKTLDIPHIDLAGDVSIPQFGLGVFQVPPEKTFENVTHALNVGYRHIDTARAYQNEAQVGQAVKSSDLSREELFITTKLWNDDIRRGSVTDAFDQSLERLGLEFIDLSPDDRAAIARLT